MPRPKRTKVAPSAPATRPRLQQVRAPPEDPIEDILAVSDDISNAKRTKRSDRSTRQSEARVSEPISILRGVDSERHRELEGQKSRRDDAMRRLDANNISLTAEIEIPLDSIENVSSSPPVEVGRRERARLDGEYTGPSITSHRPSRQSSLLGRGRRGRSSSIDSDLAESTGLVNKPRRDPSLQLGGIRRRARQPSILGRRARSSSIGLEMTPVQPGSVLNVRRRKRQPSILGTSRRPRPMVNNLSDPNAFDDLNGEEEFAPEDASTPLNTGKARLSRGGDDSQQASSVTRSQERKSSPLSEEGRTSTPLAEPNELSETETELPEALRPSHDQTPELLSETMAPPQSSSPVPEVLQPSRRANIQVSAARRQQPSRRRAPTPPPYDDDSLPSSPPSLTHSPNNPTRARAPPNHTGRTSPDPAAFSTVQLQSLLPRRRRRTRDAFAIGSDDEAAVDVTGLASDDDELAHLRVRTRNNRRTPAPSRKVTKLKSKGKGTGSEASRRTYSARRDSNEENLEDEDVDPDDSLGPLRDNLSANESAENSQELEERVGKELKKAKRKFEDVDQWELEFEDNTASSSSQLGAR